MNAETPPTAPKPVVEQPVPTPAILFTTRIEQLEQGVYLDWIDECTVIAKFTIFTKPQVDAWYTRCAEIRMTWSDSTVIYIGVDLSDFNDFVNVYFNERATALTKIRPELRSCNAIRINRSITGQILASVIRTSQIVQFQSRLQIVFSYEEMLRWLRYCKRNEDAKQKRLL